MIMEQFDGSYIDMIVPTGEPSNPLFDLGDIVKLPTVETKVNLGATVLLAIVAVCVTAILLVLKPFK